MICDTVQFEWLSKTGFYIYFYAFVILIPEDQ